MSGDLPEIAYFALNWVDYHYFIIRVLFHVHELHTAWFHYDPILKDIDNIFGKDSVWFTEKGKDGNSQLFSLLDFKGLNKLSS